jgi:ABC-2 type transport system permease protein
VKTIWIIYKKELICFLKSPLFFMMGFLATLLFTVTFLMGIQNFSNLMSNSMLQMAASPQQMNIHYAVFLQHLSLVNLFFMFFTPALAMKLIAEEKKTRSFDLLMTCPVHSSQIICAKYAALMSVLFIFEAIAFIYIFSALKMFDFQLLNPLLTGLGIFMVGALYAAMSLFASSLTDNPIISLILGTVMNIAIWIVGGLAEFIDPGLVKNILEQVSVNQHLQLLIDGVYKTNTIIFFISFSFLFCFFAERVIESSRWRSS